LNLASETAQTRDLQTFPFGNINLPLPSLTPPTIDLATRRDADYYILGYTPTASESAEDILELLAD